MEKILYNVLPFTIDDVMQSPQGMLLKEYQAALTNTMEEIKEIVDRNNCIWELTKINCEKKLNEVNFTKETCFAMDHLIEIMKKIELDIKELPDGNSEKGVAYLTRIFENTYRQKDNKEFEELSGNEKRNVERKVQNLFKRAIKQLPEEERDRICCVINEDDDNIFEVLNVIVQQRVDDVKKMRDFIEVEMLNMCEGLAFP